MLPIELIREDSSLVGSLVKLYTIIRTNLCITKKEVWYYVSSLWKIFRTLVCDKMKTHSVTEHNQQTLSLNQIKLKHATDTNYRENRQWYNTIGITQ